MTSPTISLRGQSDELLLCAKIRGIGNKVFLPFEINDSVDTPFSEIDPDYHFYTNVHFTINMKCDYYFEDHFRQEHGFTDSSQLSLFHLNIKSFSKHYDELDII